MDLLQEAAIPAISLDSVKKDIDLNRKIVRLNGELSNLIYRTVAVSPEFREWMSEAVTINDNGLYQIKVQDKSHAVLYLNGNLDTLQFDSFDELIKFYCQENTLCDDWTVVLR